MMRDVHISGAYAIFSAVIGAVIGAAVTGLITYSFIPNDNISDEEYTKEYSELQQAYNELKDSYAFLEMNNTALSDENTYLKNTIADMENQIETLRNTVQNMYYSNSNNEPTNDDTDPIETYPTVSVDKVSIFDLDTFQGMAYWFNRSYASAEDLIDTYGNEYLNGHYTLHGFTSKDDSVVPTYLLDYKYSTCEGKIAWSKTSKNIEGSCWIDFYSGDNLIYTTDVITATSRPIDFEFSVDGLETLTIVCNSTSSYISVAIIYDYLNLVP